MVSNHIVPLSAFKRAVSFGHEALQALACWQRIVVAIWAINPHLFFRRLTR